MTPGKNYPLECCLSENLAFLIWLGVDTALHVAPPQLPAGGPNVIDMESVDDGVLL